MPTPPCPNAPRQQDNHKRFSLFCKAAIEAARALPFGPGEDCVFVANDWHSALVPLLLKVRNLPSHYANLIWVLAEK